MTQLNITSLDFDSIKSDLKLYLQSQDTFNSYNFEGSGLSALLNILASEGQLDAYLANMVYNEAFLDSAIKRASVVSKAKEVGYTPRSVRSAVATVLITINSPSTYPLPSYFTLPRYQSFTSTIGGITYNFLNLDSYVIPNTVNGYTANNIKLTEGSLYSISYTASIGDPTEHFIIPNVGVDTSTLVVTVQDSSSSSLVHSYTLASDISELDSTSKVYYLEEGLDQKSYIYFGDDVISKALTIGNIVKIQYVISSGTGANAGSTVTQKFTTSNIAGETNLSIVTTSNSSGGEDIETIDSIKYNAPKQYSNKDRGITQTDYESLISSNISGIDSIVVWGGEEETDPQYGKVFISLKITGSTKIPAATKTSVISLLSKKKGLTNILEFKDPNYLYMSIASKIKYDSTKTSLSTSLIESNVSSTIQTYFNNNLSRFYNGYSDTALISNILAADSYITSIANTITVSRRITPTINITATYGLNFSSTLKSGSMESSYFYIINSGISYKVVLTDSNGSIYFKNAVTSEIIGSSIGSIDYMTGIGTLNALTVTGFVSDLSEIRIYFDIDSSIRDVTPSTNSIIVLDDLLAIPSANISSAITVTA